MKESNPLSSTISSNRLAKASLIVVPPHILPIGGNITFIFPLLLSCTVISTVPPPISTTIYLSGGGPYTDEQW